MLVVCEGSRGVCKACFGWGGGGVGIGMKLSPFNVSVSPRRRSVVSPAMKLLAWLHFKKGNTK